MKIKKNNSDTEKTRDTLAPLNSLSRGDCFQWNGRTYMNLSNPSTRGNPKVVDLSCGETRYLSWVNNVQKIDIELAYAETNPDK